jgi:hypothetical protein
MMGILVDEGYQGWVCWLTKGEIEWMGSLFDTEWNVHTPT